MFKDIRFFLKFGLLYITLADKAIRKKTDEKKHAYVYILKKIALLDFWRKQEGF